MRNRRKRVIEWRETLSELTAEREYSQFVRNRYLFFGCESPRNWRKGLNFAANFAASNKICFFYVLGMPRGGIEALKKAVDQFPHHIVCAVYANITDKEYTALEEYKKRFKGFIKYLESGKYLDEIKQAYKLVVEGKLPRDNGFFLQCQEHRHIIKRRERALLRISESQKELAICVSNCTGRTEITPDESTLRDIAQSLFPLGVEADTTDDKAVKITTAKRYIEKAKEGDFTQLGITLQEEIEQFTLFDDYTKGATELVEFAKCYCKAKIQTSGFFYLGELLGALEQPPYGFYECNWYYYLLAIAMREYFTDNFRWLVRIIKVSGSEISIADVLFVQRNMNYEYVVFAPDESAAKLAYCISKMFDIPPLDPEKRQHYDLDPHEDLFTALLYAREWCKDNIHTPLDWIDNRFYEMLTAPEIEWCKRGSADKFLAWLESDFDSLYKRVHTIDADFDNTIIPKYGEHRVKLWRKCTFVRGGAVGWLHKAESFQERLVNYMEKTVTCYECGRTIENNRYPGGYSEQEFSESGKELWFPSKDIIGLNKKLLERQKDFLCLKCLCEVLECNAEQLYEKINEFKEEGCTLFL